jgi:hypothetical protein
MCAKSAMKQESQENVPSTFTDFAQAVGLNGEKKGRTVIL